MLAEPAYLQPNNNQSPSPFGEGLGWGASPAKMPCFVKPTLESAGRAGPGASPCPSLALPGTRASVINRELNPATPGPPEEIRYVLGRTNHAQRRACS